MRWGVAPSMDRHRTFPSRSSLVNPVGPPSSSDLKPLLPDCKASTIQPMRPAPSPTCMWMRPVRKSPKRASTLPVSRDGIGVLMKLMAPPTVLGPWAIWLAPFITSMPFILPIEGKK